VKNRKLFSKRLRKIIQTNNFQKTSSSKTPRNINSKRNYYCYEKLLQKILECEILLSNFSRCPWKNLLGFWAQNLGFLSVEKTKFQISGFCVSFIWPNISTQCWFQKNFWKKKDYFFMNNFWLENFSLLLIDPENFLILPN